MNKAFLNFNLNARKKRLFSVKGLKRNLKKDVHIRLTEYQYEKLQKEARSCKMDTRQYVREVLKPHIEILKEAPHLLNVIGETVKVKSKKIRVAIEPSYKIKISSLAKKLETTESEIVRSAISHARLLTNN